MKSLLFLNIIIQIILSGEALLCYHSESLHEKFNIFRPRTLDCPNITTCGKRILYWDNGSVSVTRGCTIPLDHDELIRNNKMNRTATLMTIHYCNTNLCNNTQLIVSNYNIIFSILIAIFYCN